MRSQAEGDDGFTLIELLVSFVLLSLMAIYALQSFRVMETFSQLGKRLEAQHEANMAAHVLEAEISGAQVVFEGIGTNKQRLVFDGAEQALHFVGGSDGTREVGGPYEIWISLDQNGTLLEKRQLMRPNHQGPINEVKLLNHVKALHFAYQDVGAEPSSSWNPNDHLPTAIHLKLEFEPDDQRWWPEVIARLFFAT